MPEPGETQPKTTIKILDGLKGATVSWPEYTWCTNPGGRECDGAFANDEDTNTSCGCTCTSKKQLLGEYLCRFIPIWFMASVTHQALCAQFPDANGAMRDAEATFVEDYEPTKVTFDAPGARERIVDIEKAMGSREYCERHFKELWVLFRKLHLAFDDFTKIVRAILRDIVVNNCLQSLDVRIDWALQRMALCKHAFHNLSTEPVFSVAVVAPPDQDPFSTVSDIKAQSKFTVVPPHGQFFIEVRAFNCFGTTRMVGVIFQIDGKPRYDEFSTVPFSFFSGHKGYVSKGNWTKPSSGAYRPYTASPTQGPVKITANFYKLEVREGVPPRMQYETPSSSAPELVAEAPKAAAKTLRAKKRSFAIVNRQKPFATAATSYMTSDHVSEVAAGPAFGGLHPTRWHRRNPMMWVPAGPDGRPLVHEDGTPTDTICTRQGDWQRW